MIECQWVNGPHYSMTPTLPRISVVVVNWNGRRFLQPCLDSLLRQTDCDYEIILVDNGSTDGSVAFVKARYPTVTVIENPRNEGFARGANLGIRVGRGELVALLNNDAVASPQWLAELAKEFTTDPRIGLCGSKLLRQEDPQIIDHAGHLFYPDGILPGRGCGELDVGQYDRPEEILSPDGSAVMYRKAMLDEIGGFDEQFFAYGEDSELGLRAQLWGWRCRYVPTAVVYHVRSGTLGRSHPLKAMLVERNRLWLAVKLFPLPLLAITPLFTLVRYFWQTYSVFAQQGSAGRFAAQHSKRKLVFALIYAYGSGIAGLPEIVRKRWAIRRNRRLCDLEFIRLVRRYRINARELALRDR